VAITADAGIAGDHASIRINSATVRAGGVIDETVEPAISLYAANDIVIGDSFADAATHVTTLDGAIEIVADNERSIDSDGTAGIVIRGSDTAADSAIVNASGTNGSLYIGSSVAAAADSTTSVHIHGGDAANAQAFVNAAQNVVVEKINTLVVGNNDAIGNAGADAAAIFASGADMDISVNNLVLVQGGAGDDALATIAAVGDQAITVQNGDLRVVGGSGESSGAAI